MQPLSDRVRRMYLFLFIGLFLVMLPAVIFYADGWRYTTGHGFVRTGGIYISVPYPDASVSLNGIPIGRSGFLERSFYAGDLAPATYIVHIERDGYQAWDRLLVVEEQLVTDSRAVLIPENIPLIKILAATTTAQTDMGTTTDIVSRALYDSYLAAFATSTVASSTVPLDEANGVGLFLIKNALLAQWTQKNAFPPSHFCKRPSACLLEVPLAQNALTSARFFHDGVVYATKDGNVYFTEVDTRETPVSTLLYSAKGADLRIIDDALFVKSGTNVFEVGL